MSQYDLVGLFEFLAHTPEQGLRKMLVDNKPMSDVHFGLLLKVVRAGGASEFAEHVEKNDFPTVKLGPAEQKLKEKFWGDCFQTFQNRGLLNPALPQKIAA
ncbi:MAG: hypothetical protein ACK5RO_01835 [Pseudobdellovibrionaceae bacterium]